MIDQYALTGEETAHDDWPDDDDQIDTVGLNGESLTHGGHEASIRAK